MKAAVVQRARELGFDDCRVTTALPPESARQFERWLEGQQHGEMGYLARNATKRVDPQKVLPEARSIICLAASYERDPGEAVVSCEASAPTLVEHHGVIARYAR